MADPEVMRPQDILEGDLRDELKKAVIAGYMATSVIGDADGHSIETWSSLEKDGDGLRFNYRASILGENYPVYCLYPSGDWKLNVNLLPDVGDYPGFTAINVGDKWEELKSKVDEWLDPWLECPDPNAYTNQITSLARIASQLDIGGGGSASPGGDVDLREAVKSIENRVEDGSGQAIVAFRDAYSSDLRTTINNQCGMTAAAGVAMTSEGAAWSETYRSVRGLLQKAVGDFYTLADSNEYGETTAAVLGATSAVAGLLGATAGVAFPPFGAAMGGVSAVIGVYTVMNPAVPATDTTPLELSGSDYYAMWSDFESKMQAVSDDLSAAEQAIAEGCGLVITDTNLSPESYSLARSTRRGSQRDDFEGTLVTEINLPTSYLKEMAGAAEAIGDQQVTLAGFLTGADAGGASSSLVQNEWYRPFLPNGRRIGMSAGYGFGPYDEYKDHVETASGLIRDEGENSRRMAEALMRMAMDFSLTEQLSAQDSQELRREVDAEADLMDQTPLYRGNDPTDPWNP